MRAALDRPRLWRATAMLSALLLCGLVVACAQGSLTVLNHRPPAGGRNTGQLPSWERWCTRGVPRQDRKRLAFCARVEGRVLSSTHGPGPREAHTAVLTDFHIVIVRLPEGQATPTMGAHVTAIGPLFRSRSGQREIQAFWYEAK